MAKKSRSDYRMVPPEFARMPHNKEALAERISAQRARLLEQTQTKAVRAHSAEPLVSSQAENTFPRSQIMRFVLQHPSLVSGAAIVAVLLPLVLLRKKNYNHLWRWAGVLSPLVLNFLEKRKQKYKVSEALDEE